MFSDRPKRTDKGKPAETKESFPCTVFAFKGNSKRQVRKQNTLRMIKIVVKLDTETKKSNSSIVWNVIIMKMKDDKNKCIALMQLHIAENKKVESAVILLSLAGEIMKIEKPMKKIFSALFVLNFVLRNLK